MTRPILTLSLLLFLFLAPTAATQPVPQPAARAGREASKLGWEAIKQGDGEQAASAFREALTLRPNDATLHLGAGIAAHLLRRLDEAKGSLKRALELDPGLAPAARLLGQIAYGQGDLDLAIRSYERALQATPSDEQITRQLEQWRKEASLHGRFNERLGVFFRVLFEGPEDGDVAGRVHDLLEPAYWRIGQALNHYPSEPISVILYTQEQFRDITRSPAWAGGAYDGRIRIPVKGAVRAWPDLERVLIHEFVHAIVRSVAPRGVPAWLNEGLATHFEPGDKGWIARRLSAPPTLIPLEQLQAGFGRFGGADATLAYAESALVVDVLVERLGWNIGVFLQMIGDGQPMDQALGRLGLSLADVQAEWAERARATR